MKRSSETRLRRSNELDDLESTVDRHLMGRTVTLRIYPSVIEAELAHQFLAENGIETSIRVDHVDGGIQLLIDENDLSKAQELLDLVK